MAYSQEIVNKVRTNYVRHALPLRQAAEKNGIPYNTVRAWKRKAKDDGDDWDTARSASRLLQGGASEVAAAFMDDFVKIYHATVKKLNVMMEEDDDYDPIIIAESLSKMADAWAKTMGTMSKGKPQLNKLSIAFEVIEQFNAWIREYDPAKATEWVNLMEPFSAHLTKFMGK